MNHEELIQAIQDRHAVRSYLDRPIPPEVREQLDAAVSEANDGSGLAIRAHYDDPTAFAGGMATYGFFRNVHNFFVLAGRKGADLDEACGYHGEYLVLLAQHLGLNTCWVGLSFNKGEVRRGLPGGEQLSLVIALGYGENPGRPHRVKPIEKLASVRGGGPMPDWFRRGVEAAALAPTAVNQQRFTLELDGEVVIARKGVGPYTAVDLGIAKRHFDIGADGASWHWG